MSQILEVLTHYGIELEHSSGLYQACCPLPDHEENTPSFKVYEDTDSWSCYGECSTGGDALEFVRRYEDCSFPEAKSILAKILKVSEDEIVKEKVNVPTKVVDLPSLDEFKSFGKGKVTQKVNYRGIESQYDKFFGHLSLIVDGEVTAQFYPETRIDKKGKHSAAGFKSRYHPKDFSKANFGITGVNNALSGQHKFEGQKGKYLLIVGGEVDKVSAYQMLDKYRIKKNQSGYTTIPVVSPTTGEGSALKQVINNYDFINNFDFIVIGMDNDDAGRKAALKIAEVLPKHKVKIATWSSKDPNKMLVDGKQDQFIRDFYAAKDYVETGVISSIQADAYIEEELGREKLPLPPFLSKLEWMMAGGIPLGYIVNIIAGTGVGKTTLVNEIINHWLEFSPHKIGIMSLELTAGQYMTAMLSRRLGYKINLIEEPEKALEFVRQPHVIKERIKLRETEFGEERFALLDDREGTLEHVKEQCELLFKKHECKVLIIDPIQDLFEGIGMDEQLLFIRWMKAKVKSGVTFINICHIRKSSNSTDKDGKRIFKELTEDDVHGISAIVKSAGANIIANRNKYADTLEGCNTTQLTAPKIRWTGRQGDAGKIFYDNERHTLHAIGDVVIDLDKKDYKVEGDPFEEVL